MRIANLTAYASGNPISERDPLGGTMRERRTQKGLSITIGFLFVAAVLVAIAMIGFRVTPAYIEYYSVQKALQRAVDDAKDLGQSRSSTASGAPRTFITVCDGDLAWAAGRLRADFRKSESI